MPKAFSKDVKLIKICQVCKIEYRPARGSFFASLNLCHKHRNIYYRNWYLNRFLPWFAKQPKAVQDRYRVMKYGVWRKWVAENIDFRRKSALASYHKNKDKHRNRRHRATSQTRKPEDR